MRDEAIQLLNVTRLPGRLTSEQTAPLLGFGPHDIPILVKARLLKPLGNPPPNAVKYFAAGDIEKLALDSEFLNRATKAVYIHWAKQNKNRHGERRTLKTEELLAA
jgi:hypothetical protein